LTLRALGFEISHLPQFGKGVSAGIAFKFIDWHGKPYLFSFLEIANIL
jgi:hypothetical protein